MLEAQPNRCRRVPVSNMIDLGVNLEHFTLLYADLYHLLSSRLYVSDAGEQVIGLVYLTFPFVTSGQLR